MKEEEAKTCEAQGIQGDQFKVGEQFYELFRMDSFIKGYAWEIKDKLVDSKHHGTKYILVSLDDKERTARSHDLESSYIRTDNPNLNANWRDQGWHKVAFDRYLRAFINQAAEQSNQHDHEVMDLSRTLVFEEAGKPWFKDSSIRTLALDMPEPGTVWFKISTISGDREVDTSYRKLAEAVVGKETPPRGTAIELLGLEQRITNVMRQHDVTTIEKLTSHSESELLRWRLFGVTALDKVKVALKVRSLALKKE